jgi:phosphate transport system substrate-binding protein
MNFKAVISLSASVAMTAMLSSCNSGGTGQGTQVKLQGAGASFPAPLYLKWFKAYGEAHPNIQIDYQSIGSGGGVKSFMDKTVDFAASDAAMKPEDQAKVDGGVQLLPMTAGSIVLAYNLKDVPHLKLSRTAYADIFLGKVKNWNAREIAKDNPDLHLPNVPINVVVRADSSGRTFVFTKHLCAISPEFEKSVGNNNMPSWPVGTRSKGNEGVTASLLTTPGSIGYVEYGYAHSQNLTMATLQNKAGNFVDANLASEKAALASAQLPDDLIVWVSDPESPDAYPIVTFTWMLMYKKHPDAAKLAALKGMLDYGLTEGQKQAESLGYIPLPDAIATKVKAAADSL